MFSHSDLYLGQNKNKKIIMKGIKSNFSHITQRKPNTFNVFFLAENSVLLKTICKWIENSHDVNYYISTEDGWVVGINEHGKYTISEDERIKSLEAVNKAKQDLVFDSSSQPHRLE